MMEAVLKQIQAQKILLGSASKRYDILALDCSRIRFGQKKINVHRNHNFENLATLLKIYGKYAGFEYKIHVGVYDETLAFSGMEFSDSDLELIWLDLDRYNIDRKDLLEWLISRIEALRLISSAPILVAEHPLDINFNASLTLALKNLFGVYVFPTASIKNELGNQFFDVARSETFGTTFSSKAMPILAGNLGLNFFPALLRSRIKAIAIDLDNTIYSGVLGEDGPNGVILTDGHKQLQQLLINLGSQGILLTVTSKNVDEDVVKLFSQREDFPLRLEHLAGRRVNWNLKSINIKELAKDFNISPDDFLMLDDNLAEISNAASDIPMIDFVLADEHDAQKTCYQLMRYPGILSLGLSDTDKKRSQDIVARKQRQKDLENLDPKAYLMAMQTEVSLKLNPNEEFKRLCEVPKKTNQFNLALQRINDGQVATYLNAENYYVVSMSMRDRLSDSGNIGALYAHVENDQLIVDELCLSCRALGRGVEDFIITKALERIFVEKKSFLRVIKFVYRLGERNTPAIEWLENFTNKKLCIDSSSESNDSDQLQSVEFDIDSFSEKIKIMLNFPVTVFD
jgi:FkbH-like protein